MGFDKPFGYKLDRVDGRPILGLIADPVMLPRYTEVFCEVEGLCVPTPKLLWAAEPDGTCDISRQTLARFPRGYVVKPSHISGPLLMVKQGELVKCKKFDCLPGEENLVTNLKEFCEQWVKTYTTSGAEEPWLGRYFIFPHW